MGPRVFYLVTDPDHIRHILVDNEANYIRGQSYQKLRRLLGSGLLTNDGAPWKLSREALHGLFTPKASADFESVITQHADELLNRWAAYADNKSSVDIARECQRFMISLTGETLFGQDWRDDAEQIRDDLKRITDHSFDVKNLLIPEALPTPSNRGYAEARRSMQEHLNSVIHSRPMVTEQPTVLSVMREMLTQGELSEEALREELLTFLAAGADTTAQSLTWTLFLLATNPQYADQLATGSDNKDSVDAILDEALRLYPPVWGLARWIQKDDNIEGFKMEAGSMVILGLHLTNHDPDRWENPEAFQPERFSKNPGASKRPALAFGAGPHTCIGQYLAMKVLHHLIPEICRRFQLNIQAPGAVRAYPGFTLYPETGVYATLEHLDT